MIKQGEIIKHKNFMDVAIQIMYISTNPETESLEVRGIWINQGQTESFVINTRKYPYGVPIELTIKKEDLSNWLKCSKTDIVFIRNEEWKVLG